MLDVFGRKHNDFNGPQEINFRNKCVGGKRNTLVIYNMKEFYIILWIISQFLSSRSGNDLFADANDVNVWSDRYSLAIK